MPLRDHFHPPLANRRHWESFHSGWANTIVRHLATRLPPGYFAEPHLHLGTQVEVDVATFEEESLPGGEPDQGNGVATAVWAPPAPVQTLATAFVAQDLFEVRVYDENRSQRLVAAIEFVSPSNKDRPENRRAFAVKCASYLQQRVAVIVVDVVTDAHFNLHREILDVMELADATPWTDEVNLCAVAYRAMKEQKKWRVEVWPQALTVGAALPTLPLWLASNLAVPLLLEETYEETCRILRIP
jgi:Protein of unknown function (DUF4058)